MRVVEFSRLDILTMRINRKFGRVMTSNVGIFKPVYFQDSPPLIEEDRGKSNGYVEVVGHSAINIHSSYGRFVSVLRKYFEDNVFGSADETLVSANLHGKTIVWRVWPKMVKVLDDYGFYRYRGYARLAVIE